MTEATDVPGKDKIGAILDERGDELDALLDGPPETESISDAVKAQTCLAVVMVAKVVLYDTNKGGPVMSTEVKRYSITPYWWQLCSCWLSCAAMGLVVTSN